MGPANALHAGPRNYHNGSDWRPLRSRNLRFKLHGRSGATLRLARARPVANALDLQSGRVYTDAD
eukprot:4509873-Lingulodinium_polyedra.AAC.1